MNISKFKVEDRLKYKGHHVRLAEGNIFVDDDMIMEGYDDINSAYAYAKSYIDHITIIDKDSVFIPEEKIASLITKYHEDMKVTNKLVEAYAELISSNALSLDPVVLEFKVGTSSFKNKLEFVLEDGTTVAIDESTKDKLLSLNVDKYKLVDYMKESKEKFFSVIQEIRE